MRKTLSGFTLVELIIVVAVISILASITLVSFNSARMESNRVGAQADVDTARKLIDTFKASQRAYPVSISNCPTPTALNLCIKTDGNTLAYSVIDPTGDGTYTLMSTRSGLSYFGAFNKVTTVGSDIAPFINQTGLKSTKLTFDAKAGGATSSDTDLFLSVTFAGSSKYGGLTQTAAITNLYGSIAITFTPTLVNGGITTSVLSYSVVDSGGVVQSFTPNVKNFRAQSN